MANPVYYEDVIASIMKQHPHGMHFTTTDYQDILEAQQLVTITGGGVICDRMGLPIDQDYAEFSIQNFGNVHFDMYVGSKAQLDHCINVLC